MQREPGLNNGYRLAVVIVVAAVSLGCFLVPVDFEPEPEPDADECNGADAIPSIVDEDFTANDECGTVEQTIVVEAARLSIEPGTTLEFESGAGIRVADEGALYARGDEDDPIELTSVRGDDWKGVYLDGTDARDNVLEHVRVEQAGDEVWETGPDPVGPASLAARQARVELVDAQLVDGPGWGLVMPEPGDVAVTGDNEITGHADEPVRTVPAMVGALTAETTYRNNDSDYIVVTEGEIEEDAVWENFDVPLLLVGVVTIGANLRIAGGNELVFEEGAAFRLDEDGDLDATGDPDNGVTVRGQDDRGEEDDVVPVLEADEDRDR